LQTWLPPNNDIRICFLDMKHSWSKNVFETWITRNDVNGVSFFNLSYLITLIAYQCSQRTPNLQIKYFMFHWSIYRLFVIHNAWKRDSPKNYIRICLLDVRHSWTKKAFWDVNIMKWRKWCKFVSPFLSKNAYTIPVLTKNTNVQWSILCLIVRSTDYLC
jgi:hypothetical protein